MDNFGPLVSDVINQLGITEILDYKCGPEMALAKSLTPLNDLKCQVYEPSIPQLSDTPIPSEMVVCLDVQDEDDVAQLKALTEKVLFCAWDSDYGISYWLPLFWDRFDIQTLQYVGNGRWYMIASAVNDNQQLQ